MKKHTMTFLSVILAIMILLIPSNKVKALSLNGVDIEPPVDITKGAFVIARNRTYKDSNNNLYLYSARSYDNFDYPGFYYDGRHDALYIYPADHSHWPNSKQWLYDGTQWILHADGFGSFTMYLNDIFYSNVDIIQYNNHSIVYHADSIAYEPVISISSAFACDLNDREMELVTIDFSDFNNSNYTFQYGIQKQAGADIVWYDIAELINGTYSFNEYYNGTIIYGRVMNNDEEIAQSKYTINNDILPTFRFTVSSVLACPIPNYEGDPQAEIITIDFTNAYIEGYKYYYSYDARIFHELNVTSENLVQHINEYLYEELYVHVYDENDNLILYSYKSVFSDERLGYVPADYEERHKPIINQGAACDLQGNEIINLTIDFSNVTKYVNEYNFDVVINGQHYGALPYYDMQLNENNYIPTFEVEIYLDTWRFYHYTITIGDLNSGENFEETYNNMINNGDWGKDLNVNDVNDMGDIVVQFLGAVGSFVASFFDLLEIFFNRLNYWVRSFIVTIFIELVICKIIKGVRK